MAPLGNIGLPSYRIGAINGCTLFRENQLNGGYYPAGGFQKLANAFGEKIRELGGEIYTRTAVKRVEIESGRVRSVVVQQAKGKGPEQRVICRAVICNASVLHLMEDLIGENVVPADYMASLRALEPSLSSGVLFLGVKCDLAQRIKHQGLHWYIPEVDSRILDGCFTPEIIAQTMFTPSGPVYIAFQSLQDPSTAPSGKGTIVGISPAIYRETSYWTEHKHQLEEAMLGRIAQYIPWVYDEIEWRESATSSTIERFTRNYRGAWYGWASIPDQSNLRRLDRETPFANLWLTGHWTRPGPGLVQASKSGQMTARAVSRSLKMNL
jgi:prolycopene isomerase